MTAIYSFHLIYYCMILVLDGGIVSNTIDVGNINETNISLFLNRMREAEATKIIQEPYFAQFNWEMNDIQKKLTNISSLKENFRTEKSVQPEFTYIDEWKYSYRVTFFQSGSYNISNYACSGILMASQWVLSSLHCNLSREMILIIGVHYIPISIRDHNIYTIEKTIYSHKENLILVELDRPVQWDLDELKVRAIERDEMDILLLNGKCSMLSWISVDIDGKNNTFELREYPLLESHRKANTSRVQKDIIEVEVSQSYNLCKPDMGSPILCDGIISGILLNVDENCKSNSTIKLLCPSLRWTSFFTQRNGNSDFSVKKWSTMNISVRIELQLILFLQSCYYSNERAKSAIENFFTVRTLFKDLFSNLSPEASSIQMSLDVGLSYVLPEVAQNGDKIILLKLLDNNPNKYILQDQLKRFDMMLILYIHLMGTNGGMQITFDFEGSTMSHMLKANPSIVKKYLFYLQEAVPIRLKHVHVINVPSWIDRFLSLIKPFLKKELLDVIHIHTSMDTFYEYVPKKVLPKEYGGSAESVDILKEKARSFLVENCDFFKDLQNQQTNESKRVEKTTNFDKIFGLEGTFKRLEVD